MKIVNRMYSNKIDLVFEDARHIYTINGKKIPSVTGVLRILSKPWLVPWASKVTIEKMAELLKPGVAYDELQIKSMLDEAKRATYAIKTTAGDLGKLVHQYLEKFIKGQNPSKLVHDEARNSANRFLDWVNQNKVEFLLSEQMVYSKKYNFCGTLDFVCKIGKKLLLGDIKTSNQIDLIEYPAQMAAYMICREEEFGDKFDGCILVRVGKKDAEFEMMEISCKDMVKYKKIFLDCLSLTNSIAAVDHV